jgi:hypothetical protein
MPERGGEAYQAVVRRGGLCADTSGERQRATQ